MIHTVWNKVLIIKRRELENPQRLNNGNSGLNNLTKEITEFDTSTYALQCVHYLIYEISNSKYANTNTGNLKDSEEEAAKKGPTLTVTAALPPFVHTLVV